jgi:Rieske Fe-S protein
MKLDYSLITRRTFLNTLFGGWLIALGSGAFAAVARFAFPTLGKEPDFVVLNRAEFENVADNTAKRFAWGGTVGLYLKKADGRIMAFRGVCTHMECNVDYRPAEKRFYCACHQGWFDDNGVNVAGPPPKPLEVFEIHDAGEKLIIARKGVKVELPKA